MKTSKLYIFCILTTLYSHYSLAGDKLVILNKIVGEEIDIKEREYFGLFSSIKNFRNAAFFVTPNSIYYALISYYDKKDKLMDSLIIYSHNYLNRLSELIEHFDEFQNGEYEIGSSPCEIAIIEDKVFILSPALQDKLSKATMNKNNTKPAADTKKKDGFSGTENKSYKSYNKRHQGKIFPFANNYPYLVIEKYPRLEISAGFAYYNANLSGIKKLVSKIEERYFIKTGFPISRKELNYKTLFQYSFQMNVIIDEAWSFRIGWQNSPVYEQNSPGNSVSNVSASVMYHFKTSGTVFIPFLEVGAANYTFNGKSEIPYGNKISTNDSFGYYYIFDKISISGAGSRIGLKCFAGIDWKPSGNYPFYFSFYAGGNLMPALSISSESGEYEKINLSSITAGINIKFLEF